LVLHASKANIASLKFCLDWLAMVVAKVAGRSKLSLFDI